MIGFIVVSVMQRRRSLVNVYRLLNDRFANIYSDILFILVLPLFSILSITLSK